MYPKGIQPTACPSLPNGQYARIQGSCASKALAEARNGRERACRRSAVVEAVAWLREHYGQFEFWVERDLVLTMQKRLRRLVSERQLRYEVLSDYPLLSGPRRARSADLVIRDEGSKEVLVAAEYKYEPSHRRAEILAQPGRLPVVFWGTDGVAKNVARIQKFVQAGAACQAFAVFIDEGRCFRHRPANPGTAWLDWESSRPRSPSPSVLWARWPPG
jgi:hypothetical protein